MIIPAMSNHICIRYADLKSINCVLEHKNVIDKEGYVWFGKIGSKPRREILNNLLREKNNYVLLKSKQECYICIFEQYKEKMPEDKNFPKYYNELVKGEFENFTIWFKLRSMIKVKDKQILNNIFVKSSRNSLINACNNSMASHFFTFNKEKIILDEK
ncbi:hypothetical protein ACYZFP_04920 [Clostridioides difficile]